MTWRTVILALLCGCMNVTAVALEPATVVLDGLWDFTWTGASLDDVPPVPPADAFDAKIAVPGRWDDQLDRFEKTAWWPKATFVTAQGPVRYLSGVGWHRMSLDVPEDWCGRAARLTIGWAVGKTHIWINGHRAGAFDYTVYVPYTIDLTDYLEPGQPNEILIAVDNTHGFAGGWAFLGDAGRASGITRSITLAVSADQAFIQDVVVRPGADLQQVAWQTELANANGTQPIKASHLAWRVLDLGKHEQLSSGVVPVPAFDQQVEVADTVPIPSIRPWHPESPNLYWLEIDWLTQEGKILDRHSQRFGLRRWTHAGRKLLLNGRPIYLRGEFGAYCFPLHATTPTRKEYWLDHLKRAKQIGMNYLNFAARVCPVELMEAADELGLVLQCGDHMTVLQQYRGFDEEVWIPIVRRTRQHPSMGIYGFGGERDYYEGIIEQYQKQYDLIKRLDPGGLVMPQQAIRGIDYAFDEVGKKDLVLMPFPHHANRLARYSKACDLFGHYSGGAFGYNYFRDDWREMDRRFLIYDKPLVLHELFMGMSYLDPRNAAKYKGRIPPYLATKLRDDLARAGLLDRWPTYHENSSRLQGICRKYCIEKARKCSEPAGYEFLGMTDMHFCPHYTVGILDEFRQLKPGDSIAGIRRYSSESILMLDFDGASIQRSFTSGRPFAAMVMVSLYGDRPIASGKVSWSLQAAGRVVAEGEWPVTDVRNGGVSALGQLNLQWPAVERTARLNLAVRLTAPKCDLANDWDFWIFEDRPPPVVAASAHEHARTMLASRYRGVVAVAAGAQEKLRVAAKITSAEIEHLARGGDVLLLGAEPFDQHTAWKSFRSGLGAREHHNVGTVIAQHEIFKHLPHNGWGDWQFYPVLEGATSVLFDDLETPFDPILEVISSAEEVRKQAAIFEKRVGGGRLLVSTCVYQADNPSCVALMDGILEYMGGPRFSPGSELAVAELARLTEPESTRPPKNLVVAPGFEPASGVASAWLGYGADYQVDNSTAHSGTASLKLALKPQQLRSGQHTGAKTGPIRFRKTPPAVRLSVWHKTDGVTGAKGHDYLLFAYITHANGKQQTIRLPLQPGTHDWQYAETDWLPEADITHAVLYAGLSRKEGTAWLDDMFLGAAGRGPTGEAPVPERSAAAIWHNRPLTVDFGAAGMFRIDKGPWQDGSRVRISGPGLTTVDFRKGGAKTPSKTRIIRIDSTPPTIEIETRPALDQEGGLYYATPDTMFSLNATDRLSGVDSIEVSVDESPYRAVRGPIKLGTGAHSLRCRATDGAGNRTTRIGGSALTGSGTDVVRVTVR